MRKLSVKLGILFFIIFFGLITFMLFLLHEGIVESSINESLNGLLARGNSHREILEKHFDEDTINHVVLMESESNTDVVITDVNGRVLNASAPYQLFEEYLNQSVAMVRDEGQIVEDNWEESPFISTVSPVKTNGQIVGFVYMFQDTELIHSLIQGLNDHFLLSGGLSVLLTFLIIVFLSKGITKPLIQMKEATAQISKGNFSVSLPETSEDELGELAKSIEQLAIDLNYLKKERSEFLASISHELRTPLTYIKGYADVLLKQNLTTEEKVKYLTIIVEESNHLNDLIKQLFDLTKMDKNTFTLEKENIDLTSFIHNVTQKFFPAIQKMNLTLTVNCPENLRLYADPLRLEQIIVNLLDNAIKYTSTEGEILLNVWKKKNTIHILIKDTGKGIPEKDIPYLFNRFYRVDKSRTRSLGGTGLGLAIVKELIQAHGAEINVKSKENVGTEFEIIFKEKE